MEFISKSLVQNYKDVVEKKSDITSFDEELKEAIDKQNLSEQHKDYLALQYLKNKKNTYLIFLWPKGYKQNEYVFGEIRKNIHIKYKKTIDVSYRTLGYLMSQVYSGYSWIGTPENKFKGARGKAYECWDGCGKIEIYLVECQTVKQIIECKEKIRKKLGNGKSSIHSTDTNSEALRLGQIMFNSNSIHMMKTGNPFKYKKLYYNVIKYYQTIEKFNIDNYIIDSSSVLGLYGLRKTNDIDYICSNPDFSVETEWMGNHQNYLYLYNISQNELLYNPNNYLYFWGCKFVALERLLVFKKNRAEKPKDIQDIILIKSILEKKCTLRRILTSIAVCLEQKYCLIKKYAKRIIRG